MPAKKKILSPLEIIQKTKRPPKWDGCIMTHSGGTFNVRDPKPKDVQISDIAWGLSYKNRYGGQLGPLTVAEHSVLVSVIIEKLWPQSSIQTLLAGLHHDDCEAYTHDIQAPVRQFVKVLMPNGELISWGDMERKINTVIGKAIGIEEDFYICNEVAAADLLAASIECNLLALKASWGLPEVPEEISGMSISMLSPGLAYNAFLARHEALTGPG
jgi:hypothetical protein